jgi:hypothetical protein
VAPLTRCHAQSSTERNSELASPHALIVRLPSGTEYWYAEEVPEIGEVVSQYGKRYLVQSAEPSEDERIVITLTEEESTGDPLIQSPLT